MTATRPGRARPLAGLLALLAAPGRPLAAPAAGLARSLAAPAAGLARSLAPLAAGLALLAAPAQGPAAAIEHGRFGSSELPGAWVTGIFRVGDDVWVGTRDGSRIYNLADRSWRLPPAGIAGARVTGVADFGDKLYVATEKALNVSGPGGWARFDHIETVAAQNGELLATPDRLYLAARTMVGGLLSFDGASWTRLTRGPGTGVMNNLTALAHWDGALWAGTTNNGIFVYKSGSWETVGPEDGLPGLWVTALAGGETGLYAGTTGGLARHEGEGWTTLTAADGLPSNKISTVKVYKNKVIVGTYDRGVAVYDGRRIDRVGRMDGLCDDRIECLEVVGDTLWVGTVNGLSLVRLS